MSAQDLGATSPLGGSSTSGEDRCLWCGRTLAEHADRPGPAVPRMPCAGLKSGFLRRPAPEPVAAGAGPLPRPWPSAPALPWTDSRVHPERALALRRTLLAQVVAPALDYLAFTPPAGRSLADYRRAEAQLLLGTQAIESPNFDRHQLGGGPALGLWQMEGTVGGDPPRTHEDIWRNYLAYRPELARLLTDHGQPCDAERLIHDDVYACCMARIQYRRSPRPIPAADDIAAMDSLYLRSYNAGGASRPGEFTEAYQRLVAPLFV